MHLVQLHDALPVGIEVHRLDLDLNMEALKAWPVLTTEERRRASAFSRSADRVRFAATRAAARELLAARMECRPAEVPLSAGAHGKPFVDVDGDAPLFNISHSGRHALIVLADARDVREVGIDIEECRRGVDAEAMLDLAFTEHECREIRSEVDRLDALYRRWVGKEAVLKAIGVGVAEHLRCIGVHHDASGRLAVECALPEWTCFKAMPLVAPPGYAAALAWRTKELM